MRKKYRSPLVMLIDLSIVFLSYILSLWIRFEFSFAKALNHSGFLNATLIVLLVYFIGFKLFKLDKSIWSRVSIDEGIRVIIANTSITLVIIILKMLGVLQAIPRSVIVIAFLLITLAQESIRFSYRLLRLLSFKRRVSSDKTARRYLIYGAGSAGTLILREFLQNHNIKAHVVGFIDDDPHLTGKFILGSPILGTSDNLIEVINQHGVDEIIVAMPSINVQVQKGIMQKAFETGLPVKSVNSAENLMNGTPLKQVLKKVDIVDLLERKEIKLNNKDIKESIKDKNILVTGAAGSIGSELVRQIITYQPKAITLLDINENGLYDLQQELMMQRRDGVLSSDINLNVYLASIRDKKSLDQIFDKHKFNLVFHAAAHRHVPLMETSPEEAIKNNIFGTHNLIEVAKKYKVDKLVNVSTDKAVNPTNVMGATKRFNEMLLQSQDKDCHTKFVAVRFGNVLGSNGSVVPLFRKQIEIGGPVTVTHPDIVRYFMTIPEAVSLILEAETYAKGGEIFVLDMGEPVKILDLAEKVIKLSGYIPHEDIEIEFTGLRPGEKLFEELLMSEEGLDKTANDLIHVTKPMTQNKEHLEENLKDLKKQLDKEHSYDSIIKALEDIVPTFEHKPNGRKHNNEK